MAAAQQYAYVTVKVVPDLSGFKLSLQGEVVEAGIAAGWVALSKRMTVEFNAEMLALNKAWDSWDWFLHHV